MTKNNVSSFEKGSFRAKTLTALQSGKPLTAEQIVSKIGASKKNLGKRSPGVFIGPIIAQIKAAGVRVEKKDGKFQISASKSRKAA